MNKYFKIKNIPGSLVLTLLLSLTALILYIIFPSTYRFLVFLAMAFSSVGDIILMSDFKNKISGVSKLVLGASAFSVSHVLYFASYLQRVTKLFTEFNFGYIFSLSLFLSVLIFIISLKIKYKSNTSMLLISVTYLFIIFLANLSVSLYAFEYMGTAFLALLGSISFIISDLLIGLDILASITKFRKYVWWFYPIGQILLILFI